MTEELIDFCLHHHILYYDEKYKDAIKRLECREPQYKQNMKSNVLQKCFDIFLWDDTFKNYYIIAKKQSKK